MSKKKMVKKEVLEIKKQFSPNNCAITRICGCYVDHTKQKVFETKEAFLSLPDEEIFKYFDIFRKTLSGSIGKNLINLEFPLAQEHSGGTQDFLLRLLNSKLKDDRLIDEFYNRVIEFFNFAENYYIILIHAAYDVPGKTSDGITMTDASDEVYEHLLCSICPVGLSKPGLSYDSDKNKIKDRLRDWVVDMPLNGFLFPAFNDRCSDIHNILYYTKKSSDLQAAFIEELLGCELPLSADDQKKVFNTLIETTFKGHCKYEMVAGIQESIYEKIEEHKEDPQALELSKKDIQKILESQGATNSDIDTFNKNYDSAVGEHEVFIAKNVINTRKVEIKHPYISIKVDPERLDLIETQVINGRKCLVITADDSVEVNGIAVKTV